MKEYVDKSALVAEIDELDALNIFSDTTNKYNEDYKCGYEDALESVRKFIGTLEVKEVGEPSNDLEEEIELVKGDYEQVDVAWNNDFDFIARHFYELGLKEQLKNK